MTASSGEHDHAAGVLVLAPPDGQVHAHDRGDAVAQAGAHVLGHAVEPVPVGAGQQVHVRGRGGGQSVDDVVEAVAAASAAAAGAAAWRWVRPPM